MKKYLAMLLCLLTAVMLCAGASAEPMTEVQSMDLNLHMDPLEVYAARAFGAEDFTSRAVDNLSESEKIAYDALLTGMQAVARGEIPSGARNEGGTVLFPVLQDYLQTHTATYRSWETIREDLKNDLGFDYFAVGVALYTEHPELCIWTCETVNISWSYSGTRIVGLQLGFTVGSSYLDAEGKLDLASMSAGAQQFARVETAKARAQQIVTNGAGMGTDARLQYYADQICELNTYNTTAAINKKQPGYFEPWKLVYVFDGDPNTNVVCEGYSKAFKYLCDLTGFADVKVICVSGGLFKPGETPGPHMWNIVARPDGNYMVDVTNSEPENGWNGQLFMVHCEQGPEEDMWFADGKLGYNYDADTLAIHTLAELDVREKAAPDDTCPHTNTSFFINWEGTEIRHALYCTECETEISRHAPGAGAAANCRYCLCQHEHQSYTSIMEEPGLHGKSCNDCGGLVALHRSGDDDNCSMCSCSHPVTYITSMIGGIHSVRCQVCNAVLSSHAEGEDPSCSYCSCSHETVYQSSINFITGEVRHLEVCRKCREIFSSHQDGEEAACTICSCSHVHKSDMATTVNRVVWHGSYCSDCGSWLPPLHKDGTDPNCLLCSCTHDRKSYRSSLNLEHGWVTHTVICEDCGVDLGSHAGGYPDCPYCSCAHAHKAEATVTDWNGVSWHAFNCSDCDSLQPPAHVAGTDPNCPRCGCQHTNTRMSGDVYNGVETHSLDCLDCHTPLSSHLAGEDSECSLCRCSHREMTFWEWNGKHYQNCAACDVFFGSHQPGGMYICSLCLMNGDFTDQVLALPGSLTVLESEALAGTAADVILVPGSVTEIRSRALAGCSNLSAVFFSGDPAVLADDFLDSGVDVTVICRPDTGIARWALAHNHMVSYY